MVYRIYPSLLFLFSFVTLLLAVGVLSIVSAPKWFFLGPPIPAVAVGYFLAEFVASCYPRIRYTNDAEMDGHGYVHQPLGPMLLVAVIGFAIAILKLVR